MVVVSQASWEEGLDPPLESPEVLRMHIGERVWRLLAEQNTQNWLQVRILGLWSRGQPVIWGSKRRSGAGFLAPTFCTS